jgi:hypothetical protein
MFAAPNAATNTGSTALVVLQSGTTVVTFVIKLVPSPRLEITRISSLASES